VSNSLLLNETCRFKLQVEKAGILEELFRAYSEMVRTCLDRATGLGITFRMEVEEKKPEGVLGMDVNEKSIDLVMVKPDKVKFIKIDISQAKYVRDRYFRKGYPEKDVGKDEG